MKYSEAGKGSAPRKNRDNTAYQDNYDRIFGKKIDELGTERQPPVQHKLVEQENINSSNEE